MHSTLFQVDAVDGHHRLKFAGGVFLGPDCGRVVGLDGQKGQIEIAGRHAFQENLRRRHVQFAQAQFSGEHPGWQQIERYLVMVDERLAASIRQARSVQGGHSGHDQVWTTAFLHLEFDLRVGFHHKGLDFRFPGNGT